MPRAVFLIPGVGAQGGRPEDLGAGLRARAPGGALVAASRSIAADPDPAAAAERLRAAGLAGLGRLSAPPIPTARRAATIPPSRRACR